jgi:hypothetical protein
MTLLFNQTAFSRCSHFKIHRSVAAPIFCKLCKSIVKLTLFWRHAATPKKRTAKFHLRENKIFGNSDKICERTVVEMAPSPSRSKSAKAFLQRKSSLPRQTKHQDHRVYRVPGFLSSRPNWVPPLPHPQASVASPPLGPRGEKNSLAGKGGGPKSDDWTESLALCILRDQDRPKGNILKTIVILAKPNYEHYLVYQLNC